MSDYLYDRDILVWSEHQAALPRRAARGERVGDVDWEHVADEIEDVGRSELHAAEGLVERMMVHLPKMHGWPDHQALKHWRGEIVAFQNSAARHHTPSMRQPIDLDRLYRNALDELEPQEFDGIAPRPWRVACPYTFEQLLTGKRQALEAVLVDAG